MRTRHFSSSDPVSSPASAKASAGRHRPVLLHEVVHALAVEKDDIVVDATLGGAGHAEALTKHLGPDGIFIGFDLDRDAIERTREKLGSNAKIHLIEADFRHMGKELERLGIQSVTKVLFDLGWSGYQLDSGRGFSFLADEPLLMTYRKEGDGLTAKVIVNTWSEESLADVIYGFGEERFARRIAREIVERRKKRSFETSGDLADAIRNAVPAAYRRGKIHPATKTFQALRIAVNDEFGALQEGLEAAWKLLPEGGRIAVITFHSVEDRVVKRAFKDLVRLGKAHEIEKKPIRPTRDEVKRNRRARSAKLRVIQKISYESSHSKNKQIRPLDISGEN